MISKLVISKLAINKNCTRENQLTAFCTIPNPAISFSLFNFSYRCNPRCCSVFLKFNHFRSSLSIVFDRIAGSASNIDSFSIKNERVYRPFFYISHQLSPSTDLFLYLLFSQILLSFPIRSGGFGSLDIPLLTLLVVVFLLLYREVPRVFG